MSSISDVITVSTVIQDRSASRASFGSIGIFTAHTLGPAVRTYNTDPNGLAAMVSDGFTTGTDAYAKASAVARQSIKPPKIKIYRRATANAQAVTLLPTITTKDYVYRLSVSYGGTKTDLAYTVLAAATQSTIGTAIAALIDALPGVGATALSGTITVTPTTVGDRFQIDTNGAELTVKDTSPDAGIATDLAAGQLADPDFYGVLTDGYSEAECNAAAAWCEANAKLYVALSSDSDIFTAATTDLASDFKNAGYNRCGVFASRKQSSQMAAAMLGRQLAMDPGRSDWNNKALVGEADNLTATEQANAVTKRASLFLSIAGINVTFNVKTGSARLYDTTRDIDYFEANLAADEFTTLVNTEKMPYTAVGKGQARATAERRGALSETQGIFVPNTFRVNIPKDGADDPADKAAQLLRFSYSAEKQVGIAKMAITGTVSF
jgi:hypothetical protein